MFASNLSGKRVWLSIGLDRQRRFARALLIILVVLGRPALAQQGIWTKGASMPGASYGLQAAFVNGKLYAISGFATNRIGIYDPANNSWTTGSPLPADTGYNLRQYFGCAAANGKIYVIGGDTGGSGVRDTNYEYDTANDSWGVKAPMPAGPRSGIAAVNLNGKIYVIGGNDNSGHIFARVEIYDPSSNTWTTGTSLPGPRTGMVAEAINGKIYLAGGGNGGQSPLTDVLVFDPNNPGSWTSIAPMQIAGVGHSAALGGKFFIIGCGTSGASLATGVQAYDPASNTWSTNYSQLPTGRGDGGVAADEASGKIYDVGGYNGQFLAELDILALQSGPPVITNPTDLDYLSTNELFNPMTNTWATGFARMPTARANFGVAAASGGLDGAWKTGAPMIGGGSYALGAAFVNGKFYAISGFQFLGTIVPQIRIYNPATNTWSLGATLPAALPCNLRQYFGCATVNGKIYVIGGDDGCGGFNGDPGIYGTNYEYNTATNSWATRAPLPAGPRANEAAVNLNGKIYVIGGRDVPGNTLSLVEIYDPATNGWTTGTPLPGARLGMVAETINGKIYLAGGSDGQNALGDALVFDPNNPGSWTPIAPMAIAAEGHSTVLGGKFFIVGCGTGGAPSATAVQSYDPVSNTWSTSYPPLPIGRGDGGVAADEASGKIYDAGGYDNGFIDELDILSLSPSSQKIYAAGGQVVDDVCSPIATFEEYNPTTDTWSSLSPMPTARAHLSAATVKDFSVVPPKDIIYFIGGQTGCVGAVGTVEVYDPMTRQWTMRQSMSVPRYDTGTAVLNNKIYVFGGSDTSGIPVPTLEVYDPAADQWTVLNSMSTPRSLLVGGSVANTIYAIGGSDSSGPLGTVEAFDGTSWTPRQDMPTPRYASGAGVVNNQIHVFGGAAVPAGGATIPHEVSTDEVYVPASDSWLLGDSMPTARFGLGGAVLNNQICAVGGLLRGIAAVNHLFVYQITATNQPSSYSVESADPNIPLPDWLGIDPTSGILFGRPTTESHDNHIKVTATNSGGSGAAFLTFSVQSVASSNLEIVSSTSATGRVGKQFGPTGNGFQVLAQNSTASATFTAGGLPPGLSIDENSGLISGMPTGPGNFAVSLAVTDTDAKANSILQLTIVSDSTVPIITSSDSAFLSPGRPFSLTLTADAAATFSYVDANGAQHQGPTTAGLPPGLMFDGVNLISGMYTPGNGPSRSSAIEPIPGTNGIRRNTITIRPPRIGNCQSIATNPTGTATGPLNFFSGYSITLNTSPTASGSVSGVYNSDSTFTAVADANTGYDFVSWTENGQVQSASKSYTFTPTSARTLVANFSVPVTPAVNLHASSKSVRKGGSVIFMANANAINQIPIVINYAMSGNAVLGGDYALSANQITIPPGQSAGSVTLQVITTKTKRSETATMTLQSGTGYTVVTKKKANRASVKIINK